MSTRTTAYLVQRAALNEGGASGPAVYLYRKAVVQPRTDQDYGPVTVPEAAFVTRGEAEAGCAARERAARELLNPFWLEWGDLGSLSSLPEVEFRERVREVGLTPPAPAPGRYGGDTDWRAWWEVSYPDWTDAQRDSVWELLDKCRLYEVVEIELGD